MPADYEKIRAENIARYGWDTAVLDLLGRLYSDRTHFIFELIQNAEDAGATELAFELFPGRLEVRHDGRPFTEADVRGVCGVGESAKASDLTAIGRFGIGFKSVYAYTRNPRVHSGPEHFRIESFVRPFAVDPVDPMDPVDPVDGGEAAPGQTLFVFPFDHDDVPPATAAAEIGAALTSLPTTTLLFLRTISCLRTAGPGTAAQVLRRSTAASPGHGRHVTLSRRGDRREDAGWLVWHRPLDALGQPGLRAELALPASASADGSGLRLHPAPASPLVVYFPTEKETFTGFLIQGPYRTTPARDNVPEQDPWNTSLVQQTAALLTSTLIELRDQGLLTAGVLSALPLDAARFAPGSMLRALFEATAAALAAEPLIPVAGGGYAVAGEVLLGSSPSLRGLLPVKTLTALYGGGRPLRYADESITADQTPLLNQFLRDELGVAEATPASVTEQLTEAFLAAQPDAWIARLYAFLHDHRSLWAELGPLAAPGSAAPGLAEPGLAAPGPLAERGLAEPGLTAEHGRETVPPARRQPIIRLEDGRQIAPFTPGGRPAAYLPGAAAAGLPVVRRAVAADPAARDFLIALGFAEPDLVAAVLDGVLPRYDDLDVASLDPVRHDMDLEQVAAALDGAPAGRRQDLLERLRQTPFLIGENAASQQQALVAPPLLYQRSRDLEAYFGGNPDAWFAADQYGPWRAQLRDMGVREQVTLHRRAPDLTGHVIVAAEFARHERGLDGFDPQASFDGLAFALAHPDHARCEYVWNTLLVPHAPLVAGVVEQATRQGYQDGRREHVLSTLGALATTQAWLPGRDGALHRPGDLELDDLPPGFQRDERLAHALGMGQAVVDEASRVLGLPPGLLRGLSQRPDLVVLVERELSATNPSATNPSATNPSATNVSGTAPAAARPAPPAGQAEPGWPR